MNEELRNLINSLSVDNFRLLVREMNKQKYGTPLVRIVDGPYDGGNDLEIMIGETEIRKNIQVTVQKMNWEDKLKDDIIKAKANVGNYKYLNKLDFYISRNVPKDKRNQLETEAEILHGIDLKIIDATILANDADEFDSIKSVTHRAHGIGSSENSRRISKESKILFDVLTGNRNTVEIRKNLIYSFIYSFLFNHPESNLESIHSYLAEIFQNSLEEEYLFKEINLLKSKGYIVSTNSKDLFSLSKDKENEIQKLQEKINIQEHLLIKEIESFITSHSIDCEVQDLIEKIHKIYVENYQIDIEEVQNTSSSFSSSLKRSFSDLQKFLTDHGVESSISNVVAKEILNKCSQKEYLNKIATTSLFTNLYNSNKLEEYINSKVQTVFLDTQILIRLLCVYYKEDFPYEDNALRAVQSLYHTVENNIESVRLVTSMDYIEEVAGHFQEALKLQRFMNLPFIEDFGVSKNVFYNVYNSYLKAEIIDEETELIELIGDILGEDFDAFDEQHFISQARDRLYDLFEVAGVEIINQPYYEDYTKIKRDYEISLAFAGKDRSYSAREHDLRTILYLSKEDNHRMEDTGEINEPFLLTWDSAFYDFRKSLLNKYKQFNYWYIYSPLKFIDRLSVMNFKIEPNAITHNVVALAETNFNYSTKTKSFFDVISTFFNEEDVSRLSILKKLADLKKETQDLDGKPSEEESIFDLREVPVTTVLIKIKDHYSSFDEKKSFNDVVNVFENESFEEEIVRLIREAVKDYKNTKIMEKTIDGLNTLIEKAS